LAIGDYAPWALGMQLVNLSDGSGAIGADGPLDSEPQRRWHVGYRELASATAAAVAKPSTPYTKALSLSVDRY